MEARRMLVDLVHAAPGTTDDVLAMATRPVIVSHTGVKATCDNLRNLSDFNVAVCGDDTAAIARAIRHTADTAGVESVALGSDFDGAVTTPFGRMVCGFCYPASDARRTVALNW